MLFDTDVDVHWLADVTCQLLLRDHILINFHVNDDNAMYVSASCLRKFNQFSSMNIHWINYTTVVVSPMELSDGQGQGYWQLDILGF